jgi:hypothetical protein
LRADNRRNQTTSQHVGHCFWPKNVPKKNPFLRPTFCIKFDKGSEASIAPKTMQDIGIVAKHIFFAKDCPAKPAIINTIGN